LTAKINAGAGLLRKFSLLVLTKSIQNAGNSSAAEAPFGGIKDSGWGKESGKDVAVNEFMISKTATLTIKGDY